MNILLINPWVTDFAAYDFWSRPLGLLYAGAFLRRRGHDVRMVDCMDRFQEGGGHQLSFREGAFGTGKFHREIIPKPDCLRHIPRNFNRYGIPLDLFDSLVLRGGRPDVILVTCVMTYWYHGAFSAIERVKSLLPDVPVVFGGIYATLCHDHAVSESGADSVVIDKNPRGIIHEIERIAGFEGTGDIPGDCFSSWPEPAWDVYGALPSAVVLTSRGCPMNCTVCASRQLFDGFERRDPRDAVGHIVALAGRGVRDCAFADDALLLDPGRFAVPLFEAVAEAGAPLRLHTPNGLHVREITPEIARLMKRAGVVTVRLSLETSSVERAPDFSGKVTRRDFRSAVAALYGAGYTPRDLGAYVLAGLPGQTLKEVEDTVAFAHDCGVPVKPALFSPVPGTVEFGRAVDAGMVSREGDPVLQNNTLRASDWFAGGEREYREFRKRVTLMNEVLTNDGR